MKFFAFKNGLYAFIFLMIFGFAFILGKYIEAFFLFISYLCIRYLFPKTFHHTNTYMCVFWSIVAFWICIVLVLPISVSILSSIIIVLILCYVLYKVQDYVDMRNELMELKTVKQFNINTCTRDEFILRCREVGLHKDNIDIALAYFLDKSMNIWDIATKYSIDYDSAKRRVSRIKQKIS